MEARVLKSEVAGMMQIILVKKKELICKRKVADFISDILSLRG